jgi:hypothetical protein
MKQICFFMLLATLAGCHSDPAVPGSIIPATCQLGMIETVDESTTTDGNTSVQTSLYNAFGSVVSESFRRKQGTVTTTWDARYTYSEDKFLTTYEQTGGPGIREAYQYDDTKHLTKVQRTASGGNQTIEYTYSGDNVSEYTVKNSSGVATARYTFASGTLTGVTFSNGSATVTGGKITSRVYADGASCTYQFDSQGRMTSLDSTRGTAKYQFTYAYDTRNYAPNASLLQRGWPKPDLDLGGINPVGALTALATSGVRVDQLANSRLAGNLASVTYRLFTNGVAGSPIVTTYQYAYNSQNFPRGFARSDGFRTKYYYTNCP